MKRRNHWIMGSAIGLAAVAVAIDHTKHRVPSAEPIEIQQDQLGTAESGEIIIEPASPCALETPPCTL